MSEDRHLLGLVGAGIGASLSPALHEREADRLGLRCLYQTIDIAELGLAAEAIGDVLAAARLAGFDGLNVTHPCKQTVIEHLDALAPEAAALGAVNTVVFADGRAAGHNTDAPGFAEGFARGLPDADLDRVVLLGAGDAEGVDDVVRRLLVELDGAPEGRSWREAHVRNEAGASGQHRRHGVGAGLWGAEAGHTTSGEQRQSAGGVRNDERGQGHSSIGPFDDGLDSGLGYQPG